jgi:hypothetical protein
MKLQLKTPINIEDKTYEFVHLSLSTSTGFSNPEEYTLALRLTPYRILEDGTIDKLENETSSHSYLNALNSPISEEFIEIINTLQKLLNK